MKLYRRVPQLCHGPVVSNFSILICWQSDWRTWGDVWSPRVSPACRCTNCAAMKFPLLELFHITDVRELNTKIA